MEATSSDRLPSIDTPLSGVRVLSLAQQLPGPFCTLLLRDLGAEVILLEQLPHGDPTRRGGDLFALMNRGKRSIAVDLKTEIGQQAVHGLIPSVDVVIEGFRPGVAERLAVDFERVRALRPGIVYCSISGYGQSGPDRLRPGHDLSFQARAAAIDERSINVDVPIADVMSAMFAATRILAALTVPAEHRRSIHLDVSMADAALAANVFAGSALRRGAARIADVTPTGEPGYGLFATADGAVVLSIAFEPHFWSALCHALGRPEYAALDVFERRARADELRSWIADCLSDRTTTEVMTALSGSDVPVERVSTIADLAVDPLFRSRGMIVERSGEHWLVPPLGDSAASVAIDEGTPALGAHTRQYLEDVLGRERFDAAVANGALLDAPSR